MSLIKGKQEFRTILDFSKGKISKNMIKRALRSVEVRELVQLPDSTSYTFVENDISVGMYRIRLSFSSLDSSRTRTHLREYGGFKIAIYEHSGNMLRNINIENDRRFKRQYWVQCNKDYGIRMKTLTDVIMYVKRLNNLKMFL